MYPRQKIEECEKMLSVNSVTKMLTKERKYSDRGVHGSISKDIMQEPVARKEVLR